MKFIKKIYRKLCQVGRLLHYIRETRKENQEVCRQNEELGKDNYRLTVEIEHMVDHCKRVGSDSKKKEDALRKKAIELKECQKQLKTLTRK